MKKMYTHLILIILILTVSGCTNVGSDCSDSDDGKDFFKKGQAYGYYDQHLSGGPSKPPVLGLYDDECTSRIHLNEYYCADDSMVEMSSYLCPNGCEDGACLPETYIADCENFERGYCDTYTSCYWDLETLSCYPITNRKKCTDTDGGRNVSLGGQAYGFSNEYEGVRIGCGDYCEDGVVTECYCVDEYYLGTFEEVCTNGCNSFGECI